jgi:hypothetical protein
MKKKSYQTEKHRKAAEKELKNETPIIVFFHKDGCPACIGARPAWDAFTKSMEPSKYRIVDIEEQAIPLEVMEGISGFPTYAKDDEHGSHAVTGSITNPADIPKRLRIADARR